MANLTGHVRYAFNRRQGGAYNGKYHLVLNRPLSAGRLTRRAGDALCKPSNKFWGLEKGSEYAAVDCPTCLQRAERYSIQVPEPKLKCRRSPPSTSRSHHTTPRPELHGPPNPGGPGGSSCQHEPMSPRGEP